MVGSWAIAGGILGFIMGVKDGGMSIITGPIIFAAIGAALRRWIFGKFGI